MYYCKYSLHNHYAGVLWFKKSLVTTSLSFYSSKLWCHSCVALVVVFSCFLMPLFSQPSTAMKVTRRPLATTSHRAVDRVEVVTAAVEVRLVAMGAAGATNNHPNTEEVTTTSLRATTRPLHRATVSRASMVKVEVRDGFILTFFSQKDFPK